MTIDRGLLDKLRSRGEEVLTQLSAELMSNPRFVQAMQGALRGRDKLEQAATTALRQMNLPSRGDLKRANARIETLEREVSELRRQLRHRRPSAAKASGKAAARSAARRAAARKAPRKPGSGGRPPAE